MKILLVSPHFPPRYSGAGQQAAAIIERLENDFEFTVWTLGSPELERESRFGSARVVRLGSTRKPAYGRVFGSAVGLRLLRSRFDLVWIQGAGPAGWAALAASRLRGMPAVLKLTLEGEDDPVTLRNRSFGRARLSLLSSAQALACPSRRLVELCHSAGLPPDLPVHVPNGVDTRRWDFVEKERLGDGIGSEASVVWVGAIQERKRPDFALEVFRRVVERCPRLHLHFVGGDGRTEHRRHFAQTLRAGVEEKLRERVTFHGHVADPVKVISQADFIIHPSRAEGLPNAVLEAMAAGVIPLASDLPALREIVDPSTGRLLDPDDAEAWVDSMTDLLADPKLRAGMRAGCRRRIEQSFDLSAVSDSYRRLFLSHAARG